MGPDLGQNQVQPGLACHLGQNQGLLPHVRTTRLVPLHCRTAPSPPPGRRARTSAPPPPPAPLLRSAPAPLACTRHSGALHSTSSSAADLVSSAVLASPCLSALAAPLTHPVLGRFLSLRRTRLLNLI